MSTFQPGEIVDITIKGARVEHVTTEGFDGDATKVAQVVVYDADGRPYYITFPPSWDTVAVERRAPAEWPPRAGDLWRDRAGEVWFAFRDRAVFLVPMYPVDISRSGLEPARVMRAVGPLKLMHREDDGEVSEP